MTPSDNEPELSDDQEELILKLVYKNVAEGTSFRFYPPDEVQKDPSLIRTAGVVEKLKNTRWWVRYRDGKEFDLPFADAMAFLFQLATARQQLKATEEGSSDDINLTLAINFRLADVLHDDVVQNLLKGITLEGV